MEFLSSTEINREQAKIRLRELRQLMYKERDKFKHTVAYCEYNHKILTKYLADQYPERKRKRLEPTSYSAMIGYFKQALSYIPDIPLDTEIDILQDAIDSAKKTIKKLTTVSLLTIWLSTLPSIDAWSSI